MPSGAVFHEAVVMGRRYTAQEALDAHIITQVCAGDAVQAAATLTQKVLPKQGYKREWLGNAKTDAFDWVDKSPVTELMSRL